MVAVFRSHSLYEVYNVVVVVLSKQKDSFIQIRYLRILCGCVVFSLLYECKRFN